MMKLPFWSRNQHCRQTLSARKRAAKTQLLLDPLERRDLLSASLVAAYNFNECGGTTVHDLSGNGNNGTLHNVAWSSTGKYGYALSFNGSNSIVDIPNAASLQLTSAMTLEAWVKWTGTANGWKAVIAKDAASDIDYALYAADGPGMPPGVHAVVGSDTAADSTSLLPASTWVFLTGTFDGSTLRMYKNGNLVGSHAVSGTILTTPYALHLGGDDAGEFFKGLMSQVRIYRTALTQSQIRSDMNTPVTGTQPPVAIAGPTPTGNEGSSVTFAGSVTGGAAPFTCAWNFGDGSTVAGSLTPTHVYAEHGTYTATLTVTDSRNEASSDHVSVTVQGVAPTVTIPASFSGTIGQAIAFSGAATDPGLNDSSSFTWLWNFGDGTTSTVQNPTHIYVNPGTYSVTLTVTEASGLSGSGTAMANVASVSLPVANAGPAQSTPEGGSVTFVGSFTGGVGPFVYAWDFGDGTTAAGTLTPTHTYTDHGSYTATLTVTDSFNHSSSGSTSVTVTDVAPTAHASGPYTGTIGQSINFLGSATDPGSRDPSVFTWLWTFGDGGTSTLQNPTHTFSGPGTYAIALIVTEASGLSSVATTTATVTSATLAGPTIVTPYDTIPNFGYTPTIVSVTNGNWSNPSTWSLGRLPQNGDIVDIMPGNTVMYDVNSNVTLNTIAIQAGATLRFRTDMNTQVIVGNFEVLPGGYLEVGTQSNPVAGNVLANIVIANQPINTAIDPQQFGTGLIVMGKITTYGAQHTPYVTLSQEPRAGDTVLHLASAITGWRAGDLLVLPDTRQLNDDTRGANYQPEWEELTVASVAADGLSVTLTAPLRFDHLGARDANGVLDYLPHAINREGSIMIGSIDEGNDVGQTRGYTLFTYRADVNIQNTGFCELGRTTNTTEDDTVVDSQGNVTHIGTNQGDRTPMTIHDLIGPTTAQADGYQFTLIGNVIDDDASLDEANQTHQWGIVLNNSYYGLIQGNVVYNAAGVGIGIEDGASSFNRFDGNLVERVVGTGGRLDQQLQGDGFWFRNPNNYVTNNIATDINGSTGDVYSYGFSVDATYVETVNVAAFQGADPSQPGQAVAVNMNATPLLAFSGNEVYGATPRGFTTWWLGTFFETPEGNAGTLRNSVVWHQFDAGYFTYETANLVVDGFTALGDATEVATDPYELTVGLFFGDYMTRNAIVENLNIQNEGIGISVPTNFGRDTSPGTFTIQNAFLENVINIDVPLIQSANGGNGLVARTVNVQNVQFAQPPAVEPSETCWNICMDTSAPYDPSFYNRSSSTVINVTSFDNSGNDNFQVYYAFQSPPGATTRALIDGSVVPM